MSTNIPTIDIIYSNQLPSWHNNLAAQKYYQSSQHHTWQHRISNQYTACTMQSTWPIMTPDTPAIWDIHIPPDNTHDIRDMNSHTPSPLSAPSVLHHPPKRETWPPTPYKPSHQKGNQHNDKHLFYNGPLIDKILIPHNKYSMTKPLSLNNLEQLSCLLIQPHPCKSLCKTHSIQCN